MNSQLMQSLNVVPLEDEAFASAGDAGLLFHLNPTARAVVEMLQFGDTVESVAQVIAKSQSVAAADVRRDIETLLEDIAAKHKSALADNKDQRPEAQKLSEPVECAVYHVFGRSFKVTYPDQTIAAACHPLLAPMSRQEDAPYDHEVTFQLTDDSCEVTCGKATVVMHRTGMAAFSGLQRVMACYDQTDPGLFSTVLHAGTVVGSKGAWLVGGKSGSGKSTMITRLDAHGLKILGDDLIPIDLERELVFPMPLAMSVKEPAWPIVAAYRPEIMQIPPTTTAIGKLVRYIAPLNAPHDADRKGTPIAGLLMPRRTAGAAPQIRPLGLKQSMLALCDKFGRFPIEPTELTALISILSQVPRFELIYDEAEDILPELTQLL